MVRTQIQLHEDEYRRLRKWAKERGISLAEAVRRCVAERLAAEARQPSREDLVRSALAVYGRYADPDGRSDIAAEHDRYLASTYGK